MIPQRGGGEAAAPLWGAAEGRAHIFTLEILELGLLGVVVTPGITFSYLFEFFSTS